MTEHLHAANIATDDDYHLLRIMESFEDSSLILLSNQPIGLLKLGQSQSKIHIRQFQILPKYQNQGLGGIILEQLIESAQKKDKALTLFVLKNNPAKRLYAKHGFQIEEEDDVQYFMRYCRVNVAQ